MATAVDAAKERPILFGGPMVLALLDGRKTQTRSLVEPQPSKLDRFTPSMGIPAGPEDWAWPFPENPSACRISNKEDGPSGWTEYCPFGQPGDQLWVQEPYWEDSRTPLYGMNPAIIYAATPEWYKGKIDGLQRCSCLTTNHRDSGFITREQSQARLDEGLFWSQKPARRMPRWASRITLEITDVRVERLNDISEADAYAEGVTIPDHYRFESNGNPGQRNEARAVFHDLWESINGPGSWDLNPWAWAITFRRAS